MYKVADKRMYNIYYQYYLLTNKGEGRNARHISEIPGDIGIEELAKSINTTVEDIKQKYVEGEIVCLQCNKTIQQLIISTTGFARLLMQRMRKELGRELQVSEDNVNTYLINLADAHKDEFRLTFSENSNICQMLIEAILFLDVPVYNQDKKMAMTVLEGNIRQPSTMTKEIIKQKEIDIHSADNGFSPFKFYELMTKFDEMQGISNVDGKPILLRSLLDIVASLYSIGDGDKSKKYVENVGKSLDCSSYYLSSSVSLVTDFSGYETKDTDKLDKKKAYYTLVSKMMHTDKETALERIIEIVNISNENSTACKSSKSSNSPIVSTGTGYVKEFDYDHIKNVLGEDFIFSVVIGHTKQNVVLNNESILKLLGITSAKEIIEDMNKQLSLNEISWFHLKKWKQEYLTSLKFDYTFKTTQQFYNFIHFTKEVSKKKGFYGNAIEPKLVPKFNDVFVVEKLNKIINFIERPNAETYKGLGDSNTLDILLSFSEEDIKSILEQVVIMSLGKDYKSMISELRLCVTSLHELRDLYIKSFGTPHKNYNLAYCLKYDEYISRFKKCADSLFKSSAFRTTGKYQSPSNYLILERCIVNIMSYLSSSYTDPLEYCLVQSKEIKKSPIINPTDLSAEEITQILERPSNGNLIENLRQRVQYMSVFLQPDENSLIDDLGFERHRANNKYIIDKSSDGKFYLRNKTMDNISIELRGRIWDIETL